MTLLDHGVRELRETAVSVDEDAMRENDYGSILSTQGSIGAAEWRELVDGFHQAAIESEAGIPYVYGQDDVHGVNYCLDAVYFPHNIGAGAANDEELMYQVGLIDGGLIACTKHFLADGNALYGTGEGDMLIDRGDAQLTDEQIDELLAVYQAQIDDGIFCFIYVSTLDPALTTEAFESWFMDR